jgi:hypothetical protein
LWEGGGGVEFKIEEKNKKEEKERLISATVKFSVVLWIPIN